MNPLHFLFLKHKLEKVFTPSTIASLTYVQRSTLEDDVDKFLKIPGMQLVLYGHSGCGKSTLIYNNLAKLNINYINTSCTTATTFNELLLQAIDRLNVFYLSEKTFSKKLSITSELKAEFRKISSSISGLMSEEDTSKSVRVIPIQLTPERLAGFLGAVNCVWVIEDFHKVSDIEKKKIADVLKIFMDSAKDYPSVKIICIGAVGTARELIELDSNLATRVAEIYIPLLNNDELSHILHTGFEFLNIRYKEDLRDKVIYYSNNLASICHQICYDISFGRKIYKSRVFPVRINDDDFKTAVISYVRKNSDTFTKIFDHVFTNRQRKQVLEALVNSQVESVTWSELLTETKKIRNIEDATFMGLLNELQSSECNEVIRYDRNSKKFSFSSPFFQAFLKMKLALEQAEKLERRRKKKKKKDFVLTEKIKTMPIFNDKYLEEFIKEMNVYYERNLIIQRKIEDMKKKHDK
jgi:hypothetical protein